MAKAKKAGKKNESVAVEAKSTVSKELIETDNALHEAEGILSRVLCAVDGSGINEEPKGQPDAANLLDSSRRINGRAHSIVSIANSIARELGVEL